MTEKYIKDNYNNIKKYENIIETRKEQENIDMKQLIEENKNNLKMCKKYSNDYILIDDKYDINIDL